MAYTVQQLANLADTTVRTLHYYDEIGLLKPVRVKSNGYRKYEEPELLKLQQIMFFREIDLPLAEIRDILNSPHFDTAQALAEHRKLVEIKKRRVDNLLQTIDKTIKKLNQEKTMDDKELYGGFSKEEFEAYTKEAKERWGKEDVAESVKKWESLSKEEKLRMQKDSEKLTEEIAANMEKGAESSEIQALIAKHYDSLRFWYEPNPELYRGLANMYVDDERFAKNYEKHARGLATFMRDAMLVYCDENE